MSELTDIDLARLFPPDNCGPVCLLEDEWREVVAHIAALTADNQTLWVMFEKAIRDQCDDNAD